MDTETNEVQGMDPGEIAANDAAAQHLIDPYDWLPQNHRRVDADGKLDIEASARGLADSYKHLMRRMGQTGLPPESPDGYEWQPPEGFEVDVDRFNAFRERALDLGLSKKQFNELMGTYSTDIAPQLYAKVHEHQANLAREQLIKEAGSPEAYEKMRFHAFEAFSRFAEPQDLEGVERLGNDPTFIRVMAAIHREVIAEDQPPTITAGASGPNVGELMRNPNGAYWNKNDPGHEAAKAAVRKYHESLTRGR